MSKKKTYRVHSPLRHDGKTYQPGKKVSLTAEEAEPLLSAGVISAPEETEKEEAATEQAGTATKQKGSAGKAGSGKKGNG